MRNADLLGFFLFLIIFNNSSIFCASSFEPMNWGGSGTNNIIDGSSGSTHAKGGYYKDIQEPAITVEKYIEGIYGICDKNDTITINLRVINCDLTNILKGLTIREEIPKGFELVENKSTPGFKKLMEPYRIEWYVGDQAQFIGNYNYTLKAIESGPHIIPSTVIKTTILAKDLKEYHISKSSDNTLFVIVRNKPPRIKLYPEPPRIDVWMGWKFLGHNLTDLSVAVSDPDNDSVFGEIISLSNRPIIEKEIRSENGEKKYIWSLENGETSTYLIRAFDGTEYEEKEITLVPYLLPTWLWTILPAIIIGLMSWKAARMKCEKEKKKKGQKKLNYYGEENGSNLKNP
jgi:hypothetical protein